ncbi:hypothetical protein JCM10908_001480 [Rhodotorula pacifica]|uniref:uncharacterized protein n=1 Tax=Rhodotorula pacifica TaxID=1495444 RepID=UPI00316DEECE
MALSRSRLFLRRRPDADRLAESIWRGNIADVLNELENPVWQGSEPAWSSCLPDPSVPVDAVTSSGVTLIAEALLVPREYEFRLAVACLLLERGAQPCTCTENGRAIATVLEQLPPSQNKGDLLWQIREVMTVAVDLRTRRIPFLKTQHAPYVSDWIEGQLEALESLAQQSGDSATGEDTQVDEAATNPSTAVAHARAESPLPDYDDLPGHADEDVTMANEPPILPQLANGNTDALSAQAVVASVPLRADPSSQSTALNATKQAPTESPIDRVASLAGASNPVQTGNRTTSTDTPTPAAPAKSAHAPVRRSRLPASVRSRPRLSVRTQPTHTPTSRAATPAPVEGSASPAPLRQLANVPWPASLIDGPVARSASAITATPSAYSKSASPAVSTPGTVDPAGYQPTAFWLKRLPEFVTDAILKHYLSSGPTIFLDASSHEVPYLTDMLEVGGFQPKITEGSSLPPLPKLVRIQNISKPLLARAYGAWVGYVVYSRPEAAATARKMFDGQRMFAAEAVPGTYPIVWTDQAPKE